MKKTKLDRIINFIREEMMTSGFTNANKASGPVAGFDPLLGKGKVEKRKKYLSLGPGSRKRWMKKSES
jgi:hypothetical protein